MPEQASVVVKHLADVGLTELGLCFRLSNVSQVLQKLLIDINNG